MAVAPGTTNWSGSSPLVLLHMYIPKSTGTGDATSLSPHKTFCFCLGSKCNAVVKNPVGLLAVDPLESREVPAAAGIPSMIAGKGTWRTRQRPRGNDYYKSWVRNIPPERRLRSGKAGSRSAVLSRPSARSTRTSGLAYPPRRTAISTAATPSLSQPKNSGG